MNEFAQGFAAAIVAVAGQFNRPGLAAEICRSHDLSVDDFERAGCERDVLDVIRSILAD